jgi:hypothetical protein
MDEKGLLLSDITYRLLPTVAGTQTPPSRYGADGADVGVGVGADVGGCARPCCGAVSPQATTSAHKGQVLGVILDVPGHVLAQSELMVGEKAVGNG